MPNSKKDPTLTGHPHCIIPYVFWHNLSSLTYSERTQLQNFGSNWFRKESCKEFFAVACTKFYLGLKFVNQLLGRTVAKVGHSFSSYTSDILPVEVPPNTIEQYLPGWDDHARHKLIIVDTPGFDDTNVLEAEVLKRLSGWLARS